MHPLAYLMGDSLGLDEVGLRTALMFFGILVPTIEALEGSAVCLIEMT
jgi:hypothetical protein